MKLSWILPAALGVALLGGPADAGPAPATAKPATGARSKPAAHLRGRSAQPVRLDSAARDSLLKEIAKSRADNERWLQMSPISYLATVLRRDFDQGPTLRVGRDSSNDVRIDDPSIEPRHLMVNVIGERFHVMARDPGARFIVDDAASRDSMLGPATIGVGRFMVRLSHQRFPALIVFDRESPHFRDYHGLKYFPPDLSYRFVLPLTPNLKPDTVVILSTRGNQRHAERVGWFDFTVAGKPCRLEATRLLEPGVGEHDVGVFFRDLTTGKETYAVGWYVDPEPLADGRFVLDFNAAYNPACAFSEHYNCPIPRRQNMLNVAIRAGEMDSHYLTH